MVAAAAGHQSVVQLLIEHGADVTLAAKVWLLYKYNIWLVCMHLITSTTAALLWHVFWPLLRVWCSSEVHTKFKGAVSELLSSTFVEFDLLPGALISDFTVCT